MVKTKVFKKKIIIYYNNIMNEREKEIKRLIKDFKEIYPNKRLIHNGEFTKSFKEFNKKQLLIEDTYIVAFSKNKLYDVIENKFINRKKFMTQNGKIRSKYKNSLFNFDGDVIINSKNYGNLLSKKIRNAEINKLDVDIPINNRFINYKMENLLKFLNPTTTKYIIKTNQNGTQKYFTLNSNTLERLKSLLEGYISVDYIQSESEIEILSSWNAQEPFTLSVLGNPSNDQNGGEFFGYTHNLEKVDLQRYGVFNEFQEYEDETLDDKYNINCLCVALKNANIDISKIIHLVKNRCIPQKKLKDIAELLDIYISLKYIKDEKKKLHYGDKTKPEIKLGNINKHYFLIEETNYTRYSIENYNDVNKIKDFNKIFNKQLQKKNDRFIDSYKLIKILYEDKEKYLKPIKYYDGLYKSIYHNDVCDFGSLDYIESVNCKKKEQKKPNKKIFEATIFYDFETTTKSDDIEKLNVNHTPFCVYSDHHKNGFWGEDCGKQLLNDLCNKYGTDLNSNDKERIQQVKKGFIQVMLIAHNAGYDFRFLCKYLYRLKTIEKMNGLMSADALVYCGNKILSINLRDSLKLINMPLKNFGKCFNLDVKKEILPYDLYTEEAVKQKILPIKHCLKFVKENEKEEYIQNCLRWDCFVDVNGIKKINILKYAGEYCYMDCITLKDGYNKFYKLVKDATGQNIKDYISLASMADDYLVSQGCYKNTMMLSGIPRHFIQNCVVGGRTMTAQNKKWKIGVDKDGKNEISDFDAVSLYGSSMNRMDGFLNGCPKVIENFEPNKYDGYFIYIKILKVGKHYNFPCASIMTDQNIRHFTNDLVGKCIYMDKVGLEDLIKFQDVEYEFIKGYYFNNGRNDKIKETMKHLFNQRLKYKKEKNPIQMVFKELMNSSYGKSFMKPIDTEKIYINKKDILNHVKYHYNNIKEITLMFDEKNYKCEMIKSIDTHFNSVHIGVEILSMSKRIMYEVMTLAEDNKFPIYITDTDSMHINTDCVEPLGKLFNEKYGRELIGKDMGQFHTDFDLDGAETEIKSIDCVFLGKKCYVDKLHSNDKDGNDIYGHHIRMKGIPNDCIKHKADTEYNGDIIQIYKDLYNNTYTGTGDTEINNEDGLSFNLLACRPKFEYHKNMTISSKKKFMRKVVFNYEEGDVMYS